MRGLIRTVGALMRAIAGVTKTAIVFCYKSGRWVTKTVVETAMLPLTMIGSGGAGGPAEAVDAASTVAPTKTTEGTPSVAEAMDKVKKLAVGLAAGTAPAEVFEGVPDNTIEWLTAMDRQMLCKVACAKAEDLAAHIGGKTTLKGVLVYDQKAVSEHREAILRKPAPDADEPEIRQQPALVA